jgi:ERCC4-type nuclease
MPKPTPQVVIDTREQTPLTFANLPTIRGTLDTGDYSISGLEHLVAVERKSRPDLLACLGHGRDRFKHELQRLRGYRFRMLVVEASAADLESGQWRSQLKPQHVLGSLTSWTADYDLPTWLAGTHEAAGRFVARYLFKCCRHITSEYVAAAKLLESTEATG